MVHDKFVDGLGVMAKDDGYISDKTYFRCNTMLACYLN